MAAIEDMARIHERPEIKFGQEVDLPADIIEGTARMREKLAHAYNSLADLGDLERVEGRIAKGRDLSGEVKSEAS
jgi:hypothetical protein